MLMIGAENPQAAYDLYVAMKGILSKGDLIYENFATNDRKLERHIHEAEGLTATVPTDVNCTETYTKTVLGNSQRALHKRCCGELIQTSSLLT
jgi:hypothetical protein